MKKLKRRLSQAFRPSCHLNNENPVSNGDIVNSFQSLNINGTTNHINGKNKYGQSSLKAFGLSDSLNHLADRLAVEGTIVEEESTVPNGAAGIYRRRGSRNQLQNNGGSDHPAVTPSRPISYYGHLSNVCEYPQCEPQVLIRPKSRRTADIKSKHKSFTEHLVGSLKKSKPFFGIRNKAAEEEAFLRNARLNRGGFRGCDLPTTPEDELPQNVDDTTQNGHRRGLLANSTFSSWLQLLLSKKRAGNILSFSQRPSFMRPSISLSVVHETTALGSDGESIEVSPCTSDQMSMSSHGHSSTGTTDPPHQQRYIPNVKLRQKPNNRRWSEQDIQKRLSLPADIKLPQTVVEKLNRTPTLDNPLTRKSRRASLSEIGFGKLETYKKMFDLGEGTYATVYLGESLLTGKPVALKEIRLEHEEGAPCTAIREVSLLRNLKHANVVTLHDIIYTDRILTLVFEYVEHDLRDYMEEVDTMIVMNNVKLFLLQLLRGLAYCHQRRVLHRDLKPQNLLINNNGELKLADFGLARAQSVPTKTYSNEVVTLWYRPPDVLLGSKEYSSHIDMWGVGCILFEMLTRKAMFPGSTTDEQLNLIFSTLGPPTPERAPSLYESPNFKALNLRPSKPRSLTKMSPRIDSQSADLLEKFLKYEGKERISAADAMRHPFLGCFPSAVFSLGDNESVLSVPGVRYVQETFVHSRNMHMVHSSTSMNGFSNQQKQQYFQKHT